MRVMLCGLALLALVACMPEDKTADGGVTVAPQEASNCSLEKYEKLVGKSVYILNLRSDDTIRILKPNSVATMDYRPERTNIYTDENGTIIKVSCG